ncbi:ATP synthase peripheral stalk subunit d, mitochondrial [Mantella aurantiaca]
MSGRRAAVKALDWLAFAERVPSNQKAMFNVLKTRSDTVTAKLTSLPENPPAIDWSHYRSAIAKAGLVDDFEKKFKALSVPEPKDTQSAQITAQEQEANKSALAFIAESKTRVTSYENQLVKFQNMIPFDQMTLDDVVEVFPETKVDKEKYVYWPHKPINDL